MVGGDACFTPIKIASGCAFRVAGYVMRVAGCEVRVTRHEVRGAGFPASPCRLRRAGRFWRASYVSRVDAIVLVVVLVLGPENDESKYKIS